jgi:hypothetical protein
MGLATAAGVRRAHARGNTDQAHFVGEFRAFTGSPSAAFMRRVLPDEGGFTD